MKNIKRFAALFLAVVMAVMTIGSTTAFAAEAPSEDGWIDCGYIETSSTNRYTITNDTFNMSGSHMGGIRTYNYNYVGFDLMAFPQSGGYLTNTVIVIRLYDATTKQVVKEWQCNETYNENGYPITYGHRYQFQYFIAYGTQDIKINMGIFGRM